MLLEQPQLKKRWRNEIVKIHENLATKTDHASGLQHWEENPQPNNSCTFKKSMQNMQNRTEYALVHGIVNWLIYHLEFKNSNVDSASISNPWDLFDVSSDINYFQSHFPIVSNS